MKEKAGILLAMLGFILSISYTLFIPDLNDFTMIFMGYAFSFSLYIVMMQQEISWKRAITLGILVRVIAIFSFPNLSDDIYRFVWDGMMINEGYSAFSFLPSEYPGQITPFHDFLLERMNSKDYYSVYPTILQGIFSISYFLAPSNIFVQSILLKLFVVLAELITLIYASKIFEKLGSPKERFLWYFLNPLVIIELTGNIHMEAIMISGFAVFIYYFFWGAQGPKKYILAALTLSISVGAKLITVLALPFSWKRLKNNNKVVFYTWITLFLVILFFPMFYSSIRNFGTGLDLYFQKFEFNASIYYILREIGYLIKGYNLIYTIGPTLAIFAAGIIMYKAYKEDKRDLKSFSINMMQILTIYYLLSTTVHPWYLTLIVFLSIFNGQKYPVYWSFLIVLSYSKYYLDGKFYYLLITVEYLMLFFALYLYITKKDKGIVEDISKA